MNARRTTRWLGAAASALLALGIAELGAGLLRGRAYPYLNIFVADSAYGVRLEPEAHTRTRSRTGRITEVATNAEGFRGPTWSTAPAPGPRVLLLGDSQMFGYGVDYAETFAARLAERIDGEVLDAAVPTWGPIEYGRVVEELAPRFAPTHVLFVANVANDWLEARVANPRRNSARDGWVHVVRRNDEEPLDFPLRRWLLSRSHLVLMARTVGARVREGRLPIAHTAKRLTEQAPSLRKTGGQAASIVTPHLARVLSACARSGCETIALGLPLDLQIHPGEWAKYRSEPFDVAPLADLLDDFVADARALGVTALDLTGALVDASPGAFLDDDYHLSPRGHAAIAAAVAPLLQPITARKATQ